MRVLDLTMGGHDLRTLVRDQGLTSLHALLALGALAVQDDLARHAGLTAAAATAEPSVMAQIFRCDELTVVPLLPPVATLAWQAGPGMVLREPSRARLARVLDAIRRGRAADDWEHLVAAHGRRHDPDAEQGPAEAPAEDEAAIELRENWERSVAVEFGHRRGTVQWYRNPSGHPAVALMAWSARGDRGSGAEPYVRPIDQRLLRAPVTAAIMADWVLNGVAILRRSAVACPEQAFARDIDMPRCPQPSADAGRRPLPAV